LKVELEEEHILEKYHEEGQRMKTFILSIILLFVWISLTQYIAYLSNTGRISSWIIDFWILGSLIIYSVLLQYILKSDIFAITCITGIEIAIAIPILLIVRRWRLRRLNRKQKKE